MILKINILNCTEIFKMICFITKEYQNYIFLKIALIFKKLINLNMRQEELKFAKTYIFGGGKTRGRHLKRLASWVKRG